MFIVNNEDFCSFLIEELGFELVFLLGVGIFINLRLFFFLEFFFKLNNVNLIIILGYNF